MLLVPISCTACDLPTIALQVRRSDDVFKTVPGPSQLLVALLEYSGLERAFERRYTDLVSVFFATDVDPCTVSQTGLSTVRVGDKTIFGGTLTSVILSMLNDHETATNKLLNGVYHYLCNADCTLIFQAFNRKTLPDGTFKLCLPT